MDKLACIFLLGFLGLGATNIQALTISGQMEFLTAAIDFEGDTGTTGRRDPSDIIKVADRFYVWYSRMQNGVTSGYDASIWHASSFDSVNWTEHGEAVARGGADEFDQYSAFTPNIIFDDDSYYLYWTGIGQPGVGLASKRTAIGVATSNSAFKSWVKYAGNQSCNRQRMLESLIVSVLMTRRYCTKMVIFSCTTKVANKAAPRARPKWDLHDQRVP